MRIHIALALACSAACTASSPPTTAPTTTVASNHTPPPATSTPLGVTRTMKVPSSSMMPTLPIDSKMQITPGGPAITRGDIVAFHNPCDLDREYFKRVLATGGDTIEIRCGTVYINAVKVPQKLVDAHCTYVDHDDSQDKPYARACSRYHEHIGAADFDVFETEDQAGQPDMKDFPRRGQPLPACERGGLGRVAPQAVGRVVSTRPDDASTPPCDPQVHFVVPPKSLFVVGDNRPNSNDSRFFGVVPVELVTGRVTK